MGKSYSNKLEEMQRAAEIDNSRQDNRSRSRIAYWFSVGFILLMGVIIVGGPIYNATIGKGASLDIAQVMSGFVGQFGTPLGFVLGYYFKDKNTR